MGSPAKKYLQILSEIASGIDHALYLVGGSIRDTLLGKECSDFDFTARNIETLARSFAVGVQSSFVHLDNTPGRETFRVIVEKQFSFDFTEMQGDSIEEDLAQRDFTINAMAIRLDDFLAGRDAFIDLHRGQEDLANKIVRVVPGPIFSSDPCRMLRAFRFAGALNFKIDAETLKKIESEKNNLEKTAPERIYHEWILFLSGQQVFKLLQVMDETGLLQCVLPETGELRAIAEGQLNAWETGLATFSFLENLISHPKPVIPLANSLQFLTGKRTAVLKFAGLLYPLTPSSIVLLLKRLRASNADIQFIHRTILCQREAVDSNLDFAGEKFDEPEMYRFVKKNASELMAGIFLACAVKSTFKKGDQTKTEEFYQAACRVSGFYLERYLPAMERKILLDGKDLIQNFKLPPSPLFRIVLDRVEEARVLGTIHSKSEAEKLAQEIIQIQKVK